MFLVMGIIEMILTLVGMVLMAAVMGCFAVVAVVLIVIIGNCVVELLRHH